MRQSLWVICKCVCGVKCILHHVLSVHPQTTHLQVQAMLQVCHSLSMHNQSQYQNSTCCLADIGEHVGRLSAKYANLILRGIGFCCTPLDSQALQTLLAAQCSTAHMVYIQAIDKQFYDTLIGVCMQVPKQGSHASHAMMHALQPCLDKHM